MLHLADVVSDGFHKILLRTVDTHVVVLAVAAAVKLNIQELWIAFGTSRNFREIPVHASTGPKKSGFACFMHILGCDKVLSKGKKVNGILGDLKPLWTTLPEASISSREDLHCGCKKGCSGQCN